MAFGWQGIVVSLALGSISALVMYVIRKVQEKKNMNQSYQTSSFRERQEQVIGQRNLACPFCNKSVQENDRQLTCGHRCHESCYQKRSARNRNCTYCRHTNEEATTSSTQSSRRSSISNKCCYCQAPIQSIDKIFTLICKHLAHEACYNSFNRIMKCQACNFEKYQKSP